MEELIGRIEALESRFASREPDIHAYLDEPNRFDRLRREAIELAERFPDPKNRPSLYGCLAGLKDMFHADGFETRAGSRLPAEALVGREGAAVRRLKSAGALIVGKTVSTEFAYFGPGPTRNPHNLAHTPGGSSSGSAAAAAAGLCDLALGTQTIGSINRPAAFCGVFGYKPSFDRIPTDGVIPLSPSFDHAGVLSADLETAEAAAAVLCRGWQSSRFDRKPRLGIPAGPYLDAPEPIGKSHFAEVITTLADAGFQLEEIAMFADFDRVCERHRRIVAYEAAAVHRDWYDRFSDRYHQKTRELIETGALVSEQEYRRLTAEVHHFRNEERDRMRTHAIDAWITPAARGQAPAGLESTGDPVMNLPWTQAGLPTLTVPAGNGPDGLPLGTQLVGRWYQDERLFRIAASISIAIRD